MFVEITDMFQSHRAILSYLWWRKQIFTLQATVIRHLRSVHLNIYVTCFWWSHTHIHIHTLATRTHLTMPASAKCIFTVNTKQHIGVPRHIYIFTLSWKFRNILYQNLKFNRHRKLVEWQLFRFTALTDHTVLDYSVTICIDQHTYLRMATCGRNML